MQEEIAGTHPLLRKYHIGLMRMFRFVLRQRNQQWVSHVIFITGLCIWLMLQGTLLSVPLLSRAMAPEIDDVYAYLNKTTQLETCFWQDCPALRDLYLQLTAPPSDPHNGWLRHRAHLRTMVVFHPLYSLILSTLKYLGLSIEAAHDTIWLLSIPLFGLTFGFWLRAIWGATPAGIALALLAFQVFPDQDLSVIVPSKLSMIIAVMIWIRLLAHDGTAPMILLIGSLVLILMHPAGRIYAIMSVMLTFLIARSPFSRRIWLPALGVVVVVGISFILPRIIERPVLWTLPYPAPPHLTWQDMWWQTLSMARFVIHHWSSGLFPVFIGVFLVGLFSLEPRLYRNALRMTLVLLLFLFFSLFYIQPHYVGQPFIRMWVPVAVFLTGGVACGICVILRYSINLATSKCMLDAQKSLFLSRYNLNIPIASVKYLIIVLVVLVFCISQFVTYHTPHLIAQIEQRIDYQSFALDPEQLRLLESEAAPDDKVFYHDEAFRDFYLTHGALKYGAIYYPVLAGTPESDTWLEHPDLRFAVLYDPVEMLAINLDYLRRGLVTHQGEIGMAAFQQLQLSVAHRSSSDSLHIRVRNAGSATQLTLQAIAEDTTVEAQASADRLNIMVPTGWQGWIILDLDAINHTTHWRLTAWPANGSLFISGISFDAGFQWPWPYNAQLTLVPVDGAPPLSLSFDLSNQLPAPLHTRSVRVLHDYGASVLVRLE